MTDGKDILLIIVEAAAATATCVATVAVLMLPVLSALR